MNGMELWIAEADWQMVSKGRLEPVAGVRGDLGWRHAAGVALTWDLSGADGGPGTVGATHGTPPPAK